MTAARPRPSSARYLQATGIGVARPAGRWRSSPSGSVRPLVHRSLIRVLERRGRVGRARRSSTVEEAAKRAATLEDLLSTILRFTVILVLVLVLLTWFDLLPVIAGLGVILAAA